MSTVYLGVTLSAYTIPQRAADDAKHLIQHLSLLLSGGFPIPTKLADLQ